MDEANNDPHRRTVLKMTGGVVAGAALAQGQAQAAPPSGIVGMSAVALAAAIHARKVSCVEVMRAYLDHIQRMNPAVNAIVSLQGREGLIRQAADRDAQLARREAAGPLHGFPMAPKDLQSVKGLPYTQGSPLFKDTMGVADTILVERQRKAGAVYIGKTNTPEFGFGSHTYNPVFGITRNAFDHSKSAGGSSGGAAVALALRMAPVADGSDYGGSLRNPAGWNNVVGFRTSYGRVPVQAKDVWTPSMGVSGPMARTIDDLCLLLSVQAGYDHRAPLSMEGDGAQFRAAPKVSVKGRRVGFLGDFGGAAPCEAGVLDVCRRALKTIEDLGCHVEDAAVPYSADKAWQAFIRLRGWQQGGNVEAFYHDPAKRALLKPEIQYEVEVGLKETAFDVSAQSAIRTEWSVAVAGLFARYDYLIAPTAQVFPFDAELHWPAAIAGKAMATYHEWMKGVCLITLTGCPSLAVPAGFGPNGLPMGIQIIAPVHQERRCLELGAAFEAADPWEQRLPKT